MAAVTTRRVKGAPLTHDEVDANFVNLNTELEALSEANTGDETDSTIKAKLGITTLSGINTGDQELLAGAGIIVTNNGPGSFTIAAHPSGEIGVQGMEGFGVGIYPGALPDGFTAMTGYSDPVAANYGNYQYADGSVLVFIPRFYYRVGNAASPRYAAYGANALDIVGIDTYATEAAANAAGYAMHRAFIDGGATQHGFFIDKYIASADGIASCKSTQGGIPISLRTEAGFTVSASMTGCAGMLADAVVLSRARGAGFNCASIFMYSALALLSLAHAQASSSTISNAWYDATNNFPKGCNSGALSDTNDSSVHYASAGEAGDSMAPKTGSGTPFAKTTHNGQSCGVADLNGCYWQVALGVTSPGTSGGDSASIANGDAYTLKTTTALSSLTGGFGGANDAWGDATHLATLYDSHAGLLPWGSVTGQVCFGNGSNNVFSGSVSGISYIRTACGIQDSTNGTSASGTSLFGTDGCYQANVANLIGFVGGRWINAGAAGICCRLWFYSRAAAAPASFRAGIYG